NLRVLSLAIDFNRSRQQVLNACEAFTICGMGLHHQATRAYVKACLAKREVEDDATALARRRALKAHQAILDLLEVRGKMLQLHFGGAVQHAYASPNLFIAEGLAGQWIDVACWHLL